MKNAFRFTFAALCTILAASCAKELGNDIISTVPLRLSVSSEASRTSLSEGTKVFWSKTDQVGVVCCNEADPTKWLASSKSGAFSIENASSYTPSASATFTGSIVSGGIPKYVAYPYWEGKSTMDSKAPAAISLNLPWEQTGVIGGIPENTVPMLGAIAEDGSVEMKNACALLKFEVTSSDVTALVFKTYTPGATNSIAGKAFIKTEDYSVSRLASTATEVSSSVKLSVSGPGVYYFPIYARKLSYGFKFEVLKGATKLVRRTSSAFTFERNKIYNLGTDTDTAFVEEETAPETLTIKLLFSEKNAEGTWVKQPWPLTPAMSTDVDKRVGPFSFDGEYSFYYKSSVAATHTAGGGFKICKAVGDYLELPAITGYKLDYVSITTGSTNVKAAITDVNGTVLVSEYSVGTNGTKTQNNLAANTEVGAAYRLTKITESTTGFASLTLKYKKVTE